MEDPRADAGLSYFLAVSYTLWFTEYSSDIRAYRRDPGNEVGDTAVSIKTQTSSNVCCFTPLT